MSKVTPSDVYRLMQLMGMSEVELTDRGLVEFQLQPSGFHYPKATEKGRELLEAVDQQIARIMKAPFYEEGDKLNLVDGDLEDTAY